MNQYIMTKSSLLSLFEIIDSALLTQSSALTPMPSALKTLVILLLLLSACQQPMNDDSPVRPKNVILLVGDGMGLTQMSSLYFGDEQVVHFDRFKHIGLIKTWSAKEKVTDSAAAATSFASGVKTYNGAIGLDADSMRVETILEYAAAQGMGTGLLATSSITHATPAAFYAHQPSRQMQEEIAADMLDASVDIFAGGGMKFFSEREDGENYIEKLEQQGYEINTESLMLGSELSPGTRYGFLLAPDGMPRILDGRSSFLPDATTMTLEYLSQKQNGFFMMIEGSQIDWGGHANDEMYLKTEMIDFNEVVGRVLDFAEQDGETLVIVTADHETGGYALSGGETYASTTGTFSTGGHTATLIPVYAFGPGADTFAGIYDNTGIYEKMMAQIK